MWMHSFGTVYRGEGGIHGQKIYVRLWGKERVNLTRGPLQIINQFTYQHAMHIPYPSIQCMHAWHASYQQDACHAMPCHATHTPMDGWRIATYIQLACMHACMEGDVGTREIISWIIEVIISRGRAGHAATAAAAGTYVVRGHVAMHISRASMARSLTKTSSRPIRPSSLMARQVVWPCVCVRCHVHSYVKAPTSTCHSSGHHHHRPMERRAYTRADDVASTSAVNSSSSCC